MDVFQFLYGKQFLLYIFLINLMLYLNKKIYIHVNY
jgi:hypothetical protein